MSDYTGGDYTGGNSGNIDESISIHHRHARQLIAQSLTWPVAVLITIFIVWFFLFSGVILGFGRLWGALDVHMILVNRHVLIQEDTERETARQISNLENRVMDLDRRLKELNTKYLLLDDYTRGRIDHMPYHAPPSSKGQ